jgi:rod shape-determining protein MreC
MQNIIRLLQKFQVVFVFFLLQVMCLVLVFSGNNTFHRASIASSSNVVVGGFYELSHSVSSYFHLKNENEQLINENLNQKKKLYGSQIEVGKTYMTVNDKVYLQQYQFIKAKVINSSITAPMHNSITINVGEDVKVQPNMGVIGTKGIVGVTIASNGSFSTVTPVINANFVLPIRHANSMTFGRVVWEEADSYLTATVIDIPSSVAVDIGDVIETRGSAGMFPEGVPVGKVLSVEPVSGQTYQIIQIGLVEDFSAVYNVTVVKNIKKFDQQDLEKQTMELYQQ